MGELQFLAAGGLTLLNGATPTSGYSRILAALLLAGAGIGLAMAPATDSVMGSLPQAKASVGSAMNDTTRLVGGSFGVAVLGTVISQIYRTHIAAATANLPTAAGAASRDSLQAASRLDPERGDALHTAASLAFTDAMNRAALIAAAVALCAAVLLLPARPQASNQRPAR